MSAEGLGAIRVRVEVLLGETELSLAEIASLGEGSLVELARRADEPLVLRAGGREIARGEVVVIDQAYGLRITSLSSPGGAS